MKTMTKRLVSLILVFVMALSLAMPVRAEELSSDTAVETVQSAEPAAEQAEAAPKQEEDAAEKNEKSEQAENEENTEKEEEEASQEQQDAAAQEQSEKEDETSSDEQEAPQEVPGGELNRTELELTTGKHDELELTGADAERFESSDADIATVSEDGVVEARHVGEAVITVTDAEGNEYTCQVTVKPTTAETKSTLVVGKSIQLKLKNTEIHGVKTSKKAVATVTKAGKVTAKKAGKAVITLTDTEGNLHVCRLTVKGKLAQTALTLSETKSAQLELQGGSIKKVMSSNESVATVSEDGVVTAKKTGTATITLVDDAGSKYTSKITVETNYLARSAAAAKKVYHKIVQLHCRHRGGTRSYSQLLKKHVITCGTGVSVVLQEAGLLRKGDVITHTNEVGKHAVSRKGKVSKALKNKRKLKSGTYTIYKAGKKFSHLPEKYKAAGMVYVQDSNICVSAGGGYIYSTNESSRQYRHGHYFKTKMKAGYPFTHEILYVIAPKS